MANLSRDYTAAELWREALRDAEGDSDVVALDFEKFNLMNRACSLVAGAVYDLLWPSYQTRVTPVIDPSAGLYSGATGTWTVSSSTLTIAMNDDFTSDDIGKFITFHDGSDFYGGIIATIPSTTAVVLSGDNLPSANIASVTYAIMLGTTPSADTIALTNVRMYRAGQQFTMELESTSTTTVKYVSLKDYRTWDGSTFYDKNTIIWTLVGDDILLKKGDSVSSYGTLTFTYPRVPVLLTAVGDYVDVPDGTPMELTILVLRRLIAGRLPVSIKDTSKEIAEMVRAMYNTFGVQIDAKVLEQKMEMLQG